MYCKASYTLYSCTVIFFLMFTINEASIKWEIKSKPLVIGLEAKLSCNGNTCPENSKTWLGGNNYDLLCFDDQSNNPSKYEMTSNGTTFDLTIKELNFTDLNCVYTCTCGFQQYTNMLTTEELIYPPTLRENTLTRRGKNMHIDVLIEVSPLPNCTLLFEEQALSASILTKEKHYEGGLTLFEVSIQHLVAPVGTLCKGNLTLLCTVESNVYPLDLQDIDVCADEDRSNFEMNAIMGSISGTILVIVIVFILYFLKFRIGNYKDRSLQFECEHSETSGRRQPSLVRLVKGKDPTGATDEGTP